MRPQELIQNLCALTGPCCARAGRGDGGGRCRSELGDFLEHGMYDDRAAADCLEQLHGASLDQVCELVSAAMSACQRAFTPRHPGDKMPGDDCGNSDDCASLAGDVVDCHGGPPPGVGAGPGRPPPPPGFCQVQRRGKEGDGPCLGTVLAEGLMPGPPPPPGMKPPMGFLCFQADDLQCDPTTNLCAPPRLTGEACRGGTECGPAAYCRSGASICTPERALGEPCLDDAVCVDAAFCAQDHTCRPWVPAGSACGYAGQCRSKACLAGLCAPRIDREAWPIFADHFCAAGDGGPPP